MRSESFTKPGGIILVITGNLVSNIVESYKDNLGSWINVIIQIHKQWLSVFSVYNIPQTIITTAGPTTIYFQQWKSLQLQGILKPNPCEQMTLDLDRYITSTKKKDDLICIMGNINKDLTNPKLMSIICNKHSLYDHFAQLHPKETSTPSYKWGLKRLYYVLLSISAPLPHQMGYQP